MKIWMLQSKRKFAIGLIGILFIIFVGIPSLISQYVPDDEPEYQTLDEFKARYMNEDERNPTNEISTYFTDTTGYTPQWAKGIENYQALNKCISIVMDGFTNREDKWCAELQGFMLDNMNP